MIKSLFQRLQVISVTYQAKGILETEQETILATRNANVSQNFVTETTSILDTSTRTISVEDQGRDRDTENRGNAYALAGFNIGKFGSSRNISNTTLRRVRCGYNDPGLLKHLLSKDKVDVS